jgi:hypothetical protein
VETIKARGASAEGEYAQSRIRKNPTNRKQELGLKGNRLGQVAP